MTDKIEGRVVFLNGKIALGYLPSGSNVNNIQFLELEKYIHDKYFGKYIEIRIDEIFEIP